MVCLMMKYMKECFSWEISRILSETRSDDESVPKKVRGGGITKSEPKFEKLT